MSLKISENSLKVLERLYLKKDRNEKVIETPEGMFRRVAKAIAAVEEDYGANDKAVADTEDIFYQMMANLEFLPNSPT